ncbi:MAG: flagellar basal body rod protein FlgC [Planctomycetota bacterium]|nr:flagellar basal body rod protein FlgC [Planctomycetota bacterium]
MFGLLDVSASGLVAQRTRLEVATSNMVNRDAIVDAKGNYNPFRRRVAIMAAGDPESGNAQGVHIAEIKLDQSPFRKLYQPESPYADKEGNVSYPNIDPSIEMINALDASRAYEANIAAAEATKSMYQSSLRLIA